MVKIKRIIILIIGCLMLNGCGASSSNEECHDKCLISSFEENCIVK